jgi:hypothetical protein
MLRHPPLRAKTDSCATRRYARRLDLRNELPGRVLNRAFCAFVKPVAVCCGAPGRGDAHLVLPLSLVTPLFSSYGSTGTRGGGETVRPSGSSWSPSSSTTTPLHSRLQPWSG